jgi:hypothetical protein
LAARLSPPPQPVRRIGGTIGRQTGVAVAVEALARIRPTAHQIGLSRSERAANVQGAFKVAADRKALLQGRRVVLVDDVLPRAPRWMPALGRCCAQRRRPSMDWSSRGLWTR